MDGVRRTSDSIISWSVDVVQVACTNQDIQTIRRPGRVVGHTDAAHVGPVLLLILNPLQNSDLERTAVPVADQSAGSWGSLTVAADVTAGCSIVSGTRLGHGGDNSRASGLQLED